MFIGIHFTPPPLYSPQKAKVYIKQIIFGLTDEELKSFVKFCLIDFIGNNISHRNSFEYGSK